MDLLPRRLSAQTGMAGRVIQLRSVAAALKAAADAPRPSGFALVAISFAIPVRLHPDDMRPELWSRRIRLAPPSRFGLLRRLFRKWCPRRSARALRILHIEWTEAEGIFARLGRGPRIPWPPRTIEEERKL